MYREGLSSVMFDGSKYSIEENVEKDKEIVALAHSKGISVEVEVGAIGGEALITRRAGRRRDRRPG